MERYHLAHANYPATLEALAPGLLASIPADIIGGKPLNYRVTAGDKFLLYSIGWNRKDDGGVAGSVEVNRFDADKGDWVWPYAEKLMK